ncbi:hypothetical protein HELRODRAFT_165475 [Helobdella robusta]|uniref:Uncharacterized protein n=1 Tax=Helobdella robusta TaxID=6412 RepID=T1EWV5_HELRO|nr:hypothetical protein HELRODRAFT_165475 [Helobdella robusta]ESN91442.1 hypothetical protein HELRODRAFT_165475 [Helobdella robusta]
MNAEKLQKLEPMEIPSCVQNYTNEYRIQQRTLGPQIAQQKQNNEADSFSQNPRPVFTGSVSQWVGFRTTLACFHWAVKSDRLSHDQGPVFTGPVCQSVGFRTSLACFHWAVESGRLSHNQHKTTRVRTTLETNCVTLVRVRNYANEHRVSY